MTGTDHSNKLEWILHYFDYIYISLKICMRFPMYFLLLGRFLLFVMAVNSRSINSFLNELCSSPRTSDFLYLIRGPWLCIRRYQKIYQYFNFTGKSLSKVLIFASTNPQYDDRLFIELRVQYMKIASSEHGENMGRTCFVHKLF